MKDTIYDTKFLATLTASDLEGLYDLVSNDILTFIKSPKPRHITQASHAKALADLRQAQNELFEFLAIRYYQYNA